MAIVKGVLQLQGSLENVTYYTRRGSDKVIARAKVGPTKERLATDPKYAGFRNHQKEWKGCTKFGSLTRYAFGGLHRLADYNLTPVLNGMGKRLMKLEPDTDPGKRPIRLSQHKQMLEGFNFNKLNPFNTVLRVGITAQIDRENLLATVTIPRIKSDNDLVNIQRLPYFRLIIAIGTVSDMQFDETEETYEPVVLGLHGTSQVVNSPWYPSKSTVAAQTMTVQMTEAQRALLTDEITVLLSMAVEFGTVSDTGETVEVKYAGCGKVIDSM